MCVCVCVCVTCTVYVGCGGYKQQAYVHHAHVMVAEGSYGIFWWVLACAVAMLLCAIIIAHPCTSYKFNVQVYNICV